MVQTLLRLSIPVFRAPANAQPRLGWSMTHTAEGKPALRLANSGTAHAKVSSLHLTTTSGASQTLDRGFYVLSGGAMIVPLGQVPAGGVKSVSVDSDAGHVTAAASGAQAMADAPVPQ